MTHEPESFEEATADAAATADAPESADPFEQLVGDAIDSIPDAFRGRLDSVAIVVEDEPTAEDLRATGAYGLLGLYTGVPRTAWGATGAAMPSKITIYRGPHLRQFGTGPALAEGVAGTVRHEIAHHFGISDARLDELWQRSHR
jgi:predicted Zn-dependent protease with MMP-like domain